MVIVLLLCFAQMAVHLQNASASQTQPVFVTFVSSTDEWLYLDRAQEETISPDGQEWTLPGYDTQGWLRGTGPFGAKNGTLEPGSDMHSISTLLAQYEEGRNKNKPSFFFRKSFQVEEPERIYLLTAEVIYDDAIIVYLNGEKVFEGNVPEGGFDDNFSYGAAQSQGRPICEDFQIAPELLRKGENVLAVELHQSDRSSSDVFFDFVSLKSGVGALRSTFVGVGPDSSSVCLNWIQEGRLLPHACVYIKQVGSEKEALSFPAVLTESNDVGYSYRASITGLEPQGFYSYTIVVGDIILYTGSIITGSEENGTDMLLLGDPQLDLENVRAFTPILSNNVKEGGKDMDLLVCMGDVGVNAWEYPVYESVINTLNNARIPAAMIFGNHDAAGECLSDSVYLPNMSSLGSSRRTGVMSGDYWFEYGGSLYLCLNSNESDFDQHRAFIDEAERAYTALHGEPDWRIVFMHHAPFSQGNNYARESMLELREELAPLFSEKNIHVVFSGHDHTYSRSYLMRGTQAIPYEGQEVRLEPGEVLYITLSSSTGSKFYDLSDKQDYTAFCYQKYRAMLTQINVTPRRIHMHTWEPETQKTVDAFTVLK